MYDGKQVVRVETKYKSKDLYNIGIEMKERKGTGNYDKDRTPLNVEYVSLTEKNLYQQVKKTLKNRNIEYLNKPNTNMLNGITFTSGNEFFQALGMEFKDTDRTYHTGDKKGQIIKVPNIKTKDDIPQSISYYFDSCMDYLKDMVGEENIVYAQIHYDEDTPHLQAYFLPVVKEVKRKCYEKDSNGNVVKISSKRKDGSTTLVPKIIRDENGKIVYENVKGKFLNNDQFWKNKGGKNSYANMQNSFNKFINKRGFKLDRGNVGAKIEHTTKLEHQIKEKKAELKELSVEKDYTLKEIETSKNTLVKAQQSDNKEILNPLKKITGYNSKDVEKLIDYSKDLTKVTIYQENEISSKGKTINKLKTENELFKNNKELKKRDDLIKKQRIIIKQQEEKIDYFEQLVDVLNSNIESLKRKLNEEIEKWKERFINLGKALTKTLNISPKKDIEDYEDLADSINYDHTKDKDDFGIRM